MTQEAVISSEFQRRLRDVEQVFFKEKDLKVEQGSAEKFLLTLVRDVPSGLMVCPSAAWNTCSG